MLHLGNCLDILPTLPAKSVQCCVTSPPYYLMRDYHVDGQLGAETTFIEYITNLVTVFKEVRRVLCDNGTVWLNLGDTYSAGGRGGGIIGNKQATNNAAALGYKRTKGFQSKQLLMIPARVAMALQDDGWYLRSDIIWHKANPMPESMKDRPTSAHEHVFLLSKKPKYYYDAAAIATVSKSPNDHSRSNERKRVPTDMINGVRHEGKYPMANARNVWKINVQPFRGSHFATMPIELASRCIQAGSKAGDVILDPFAGAGTTGVAALELGREIILIELNPEYITLTEKRLKSTVSYPITFSSGTYESNQKVDK